MKVLILEKNVYVRKELKDFFRNNSDIQIVSNDEEVIVSLNNQEFQTLVLNLSSFSEISLLGYVNRYYPFVELFLNLDDDLRKMASIVREGKFTIMKEGYNLKQINNLIQSWRKNV